MSVLEHYANLRNKGILLETKELYEKYDLTDDEIAIIESVIKERK